MTGKIKFFLENKSYGFVQPDGADPLDDSKNIFFHRKNVNFQIYQSDRDKKVSFEVVKSEVKPAALEAININLEV